MDLDGWQARKYHITFEKVCHFVAYQRQVNPKFGIEDVEHLLENAYTREGNDWAGRGLVGHIVNSATIAAYEHVLAEWRKEQQ
jgi:hypothetical protein